LNTFFVSSSNDEDVSLCETSEVFLKKFKRPPPLEVEVESEDKRFEEENF
jgi:hypothetical protein